jgi:glycosyltransferase involved in cell wall biosynthesis
MTNISAITDDRPVVLDLRVVKGSGGGPDKTILNSPRFLEKLGYRMLCVYMHAPDDPGFEQLRTKARRWGATIISVPDRGPLDPGVVPRLARICREHRVKIYHAHDYKSNVLGVLLKRLVPMRIMTTIHGWVQRTWRTPLYYALDRWSLPAYEKVICVSQDLYDTCLAAGVKPERCQVLDNAIDTDEFRRRQSPGEAKRQIGLSPDRLLIGAVGRLSGEKGFDLLIRAVHSLVRAGRDIELAIAGEGDEQANLERLIGELGVAGRVHLLGYQSDMRPVYEAMDVFALSSLREGLPNVMLEAMAMEAPVAATRIAGVPRLVQDGENGLLVEPGSVEELAAALDRLVADNGLRAKLAAAGRRHMETEFSFAVRMERLAAIYDQMLERRAASTSTPCLAEAATPSCAAR